MIKPYFVSYTWLIYAENEDEAYNAFEDALSHGDLSCDDIGEWSFEEVARSKGTEYLFAGIVEPEKEI